MRAMLMHFALGSALATGTFGKPMAFRFVSDALAPASSLTHVEVQNTAFNDAVVYAVRGVRVVRLGTVTGLTTQRFTIPKNLMIGPTSIRFGVHPIGGHKDSMSDEITFYQGDRVSLFIPPF